MSGHNNLDDQQVVYYGDAGVLRFAGGGNSGAAHGGGGGGGTTPIPTLVGAGNFHINLMWDSSVSSAPAGFVNDVKATATYLTTLFTNSETINIHVGWGEINGQGMSGGALGESMTNGYLENIATLESQLGVHASNEPTSGYGWVSNAQAKLIGILANNSTAVDGYVGFGTNVQWNYTYGANGTGTGTQAGQYDLQGVVFHELTEVMGRVSMEGVNYHGQHIYSGLDLFDFSAPNTLQLSTAGGYYSTDNGTTSLGVFNGSAHSGDIADWASWDSANQSGTLDPSLGDQDAFNAFGRSGIDSDLSHADVQLMDSIGYTLSDLGALV